MTWTGRPVLLALGGHDAVPRRGLLALHQLVARTPMQDFHGAERADAQALLAWVTNALEARAVATRVADVEVVLEELRARHPDGDDGECDE